MRIALTLKSRNAKTGPIPVSTTEARTCPDACPFRGNGCYAQGGPLAIFWRKVSEGSAGMHFKDFLAAVSTLPEGQLWRHNQAGDLPGEGDRIDGPALFAIVRANKGKRGFTYTHKPMATKHNRDCVAKANKRGFTVNLSANDLHHADALADLEIGPVVTVLPDDHADKVTLTPKGRTVVTCPATYRDDVSCATCQLCQRQRRTIVGFPAHGAAKRKASIIAQGSNHK